jgi:hypothetical protein
MFTVYIDDSGTDPNQQVAIATAMIVPAARVAALDREWNILTTKEQFPDFHMSACLAHNAKTCFGGWDEIKTRRVVERVRQIGKKFGSQVFSLAVKKADYDELLSDEMKEFAGRYHYTWAIRNMIDLLNKWANVNGVALPFEYIYDWMDPKAQREAKAEIDTVMAQAEHLAIENGRPGRYTNYSFRRRQDVPALQCADAIAWTCYQYALLALSQNPLSQIAEACWDDYFNHTAKDWLYAAATTRAQLADWVKREQEHGQPDFERFRRWQDTNPKLAPKRRKKRV